MEDKNQILKNLKDEFNRWEEFLAGQSEAQLTAVLSSGWSIKDVMAHLMTWQRRSIARMEAGLENREPQFPPWLDGLDPNDEEPTERINAWIHETNRDRPWRGVYRDWHDGFLKFIRLGEGFPEKDLLEAGRYPWLADYPIAIVLDSSREHHREHMEMLEEWMGHRRT